MEKPNRLDVANNPWRLARKRMVRKQGRDITWREFAESIGVTQQYLEALAGPSRHTRNVVLMRHAARVSDGAFRVKEGADWAEMHAGTLV